MLTEKTLSVNQPAEKKGWILITHDNLVKYHELFIKRHQALNAEFRNFDFSMDIKEITIDIQFLSTLIHQAEQGHYLVAHYICNDDLKKMSIALCVKQKKDDGEVDDIVKGAFYDPSGRPLDYHAEFLPGIVNYYKRRSQILHASRSSTSSCRAYDFDREGRAHEVTDFMRDVVKKLADSRTNMQAYFILDDYNSPGIKQLSVAFSDRLIEGDDKMGTLAKDDAYDHGTACCPIG